MATIEELQAKHMRKMKRKRAKADNWRAFGMPKRSDGTVTVSECNHKGIQSKRPKYRENQKARVKNGER